MPERTYSPSGMLAAIGSHGCELAPLAGPDRALQR
jgi:hypothetical protein